MKVLISEYENVMFSDHTLEVETLRAGLGEDVEIDIFPYADERRAEFFEHIANADALLTAFMPIDAEVFDHAPKLKVVAVNATGWDAVDVDEATRRNIGVCPIGEYCTWDVAESAVAYMLALNKHLKFYGRQIDEEHRWEYEAPPAWLRLEDQTLGIVGFGKIGKCTARKAAGLVKDIVAYDPYVASEAFEELGVERMETPDELFARADIISNHMPLTKDNKFFFNEAAFQKMAARKPLLLNLGRGLCVDEDALVRALDEGTIRGYAADVLYDERPDLAKSPLVGRDDVIITPHSAFYSSSSMRDIKVFSCNNIVHYLKGEKDKLFKLINDVTL